MFWVLGRFREPFANAAGVFVASAADVAGAVGASDLLTSGFSADAAGIVAGNPVYGCGATGGAGSTGAGSGVSSGAGAGGTGPGRCVIGGVAGPDFVIIVVNVVGGFGDGACGVVTDLVTIVSVVCGDDGRDMVSPFVDSGDSGRSDGNVFEFAVRIKCHDDIAWADTFKGNFSGGVGVSGAEDAVADKACKSATGCSHACPVFCAGYIVVVFDSVQCLAYGSCSGGVVVPGHSVGILF